MGTFLERIAIILSHPEEAGNIGSTCRAMKTMGLSRLRIVGERRYDERQIEYMSVHAFEVYERAAFYPTVEEALADTVLSAGVTRRRGVKRKAISLLPEELAERAAASGAGTVGVVFGNERSGLSDAELSACALAVHIPTSPQFPSLNLSQAVQIIAYTLFRHDQRPARFTPVARERIETLAGSAIGSLGAIGFFSVAGNSVMTEFLRDVFTRASLSKGEADRMEEMFMKIKNLKIHKPQ